MKTHSYSFVRQELGLEIGKMVQSMTVEGMVTALSSKVVDDLQKSLAKFEFAYALSQREEK